MSLGRPLGRELWIRETAKDMKPVVHFAKEKCEDYFFNRIKGYS